MVSLLFIQLSPSLRTGLVSTGGTSFPSLSYDGCSSVHSNSMIGASSSRQMLSSVGDISRVCNHFNFEGLGAGVELEVSMAGGSSGPATGNVSVICAAAVGVGGAETGS